MSTITAPAAASHPKRSPYFSSCQREDEKSQFLRVDCFFADSRDWIEESIGPVGDWIPSEVIEEHRERMERALRRRNRSQFESTS
jgi:hypothetical protein